MRALLDGIFEEEPDRFNGVQVWRRGRVWKQLDPSRLKPLSGRFCGVCTSICWIPVVWYSGWYPSLGLARLSGPASSFLCSVPFFRFCFYIHIINKRWQVYPLIPIAVSTLYTTCFRTSAHFRGCFPPSEVSTPSAMSFPSCLYLFPIY